MTAEELAAIVGDDAAYTFVCRRAGDRCYIPKTATPQLVEFLGGDAKAAARMAREFGGETLQIPIARTWRIQKLYRDGVPVREIALALCCSQTYVHAVMRRSANAGGADRRVPKAA